MNDRHIYALGGREKKQQVFFSFFGKYLSKLLIFIGREKIIDIRSRGRRRSESIVVPDDKRRRRENQSIEYIGYKNQFLHLFFIEIKSQKRKENTSNRQTMRVVVLPVCLLESYPHVLLKYDFRVLPQTPISSPSTTSTFNGNKSNLRSSQEFYLTPYCSPILPSGSIHTVCEIVKGSSVLRQLFDVKKEDEENLENKIDFKGHCRFIAFGPETDICICALYIPHISSLELNYINQPDPPLSRQHSKLSYVRTPADPTMKEIALAYGNPGGEHLPATTFVTRDLVHLWISIRDIRHKLVHIDRVLKQPGILSKLTHVESWVTSYKDSVDEKSSVAKTENETTLRLIKARARTLVWDIMEMKNEILYPHPG